MESVKKHDVAINDGGMLPGVYEIGSNLKLTPPTRDMGLAGYWTFDQATSGSISNGQTIGFADSSVNHNDGTVHNANGSGMAWVSGKIGGAVSFDGIDDYIQIADAPSLQIMGDLTLSFWIYNDNSSSQGTIISKSVWAAFEAGTFNGYSRFYQGPYGNLFWDASYIDLNTWIYATIVRDSSAKTITFYKNGSQFAGSPKTYTTVVSDLYNAFHVPVGIGASMDPTNPPGVFLAGSLDDVRVYNRVLSASEVSAIYNATK
jgi:hypothetical protein